MIREMRMIQRKKWKYERLGMLGNLKSQGENSGRDLTQT